MAMRVGFLGPAGTFSEEALCRSSASLGVPQDAERVALPTIRDVVLAAASGDVDRAVVPIENSLEGSVDEALDTLLHDAPRARIVGEVVLPVRYALIARSGVAQDQAEVVLSHPQALAQCSRFLREQMPSARAEATASTAEAVRAAVASKRPACALGTPLAASLYGGSVLREGIEDEDANFTRFVWLSAGQHCVEPTEGHAGDADEGWKSSVVFSGDGDGTPGWLVACLSEFASRGVNLSRIESRPARRHLGHYVFLVDVEGHAGRGGPAAQALAALASHCGDVRLLGAYRAADAAGR